MHDGCMIMCIYVIILWYYHEYNNHVARIKMNKQSLITLVLPAPLALRLGWWRVARAARFAVLREMQLNKAAPYVRVWAQTCIGCVETSLAVCCLAKFFR